MNYKFTDFKHGQMFRATIDYTECKEAQMKPSEVAARQAEIAKKIEDWLDADHHPDRLPVKILFSDIEVIAECLSPKIQAFTDQAITQTEQRVREEMVQQLTHEFDLAAMLEGWEGHWIDVGSGRYVENCMECENATKIITALTPKQEEVQSETA